MKTCVVAIDPQKDFCQPANPEMADAMLRVNKGVETPGIRFMRNGGSLCVPGAAEDCVRLARMINRLENKIDSIHVTMDSHNELDIAHPMFWRDAKGNRPPFFTIITREDVEKGRWTTSNPACLRRAMEYVKALEENKRYPLCIWPPHCIIGSEGYQLEDNVSDAIRQWGRNRGRTVDFVTKGSNMWTEHFSAVKADVPDPKDPTTLVNSRFVNAVEENDLILITGQALSHCVNYTIRDLANEFGEDSVKKLCLLRDTCSNVPGFEQNGEDFVRDLRALGMRIDSSTTVLAA